MMPVPTASHVILIARGDPADQSPDRLQRIREGVARVIHSVPTCLHK